MLGAPADLLSALVDHPAHQVMELAWLLFHEEPELLEVGVDPEQGGKLSPHGLDPVLAVEVQLDGVIDEGLPVAAVGYDVEL